MKTIDRKDLKTNELAEQLDHLSVYAKQNVVKLAGWGGAIIVAGIAIFAFLNYRASQVSAGWAKLYNSAKTEPGDLIKEAKEVAEAGIEPGLTTQAWIKTGTMALMEIVSPDPAKAGAPASMDFAATAKDAFEKALQSASKSDLTARGQALMGLGVLMENAGNADASKYYKQVVDDSQFANTPFKAEAEYRLKGLADWLKPVKFAPAPPPFLTGNMPENTPVTPPGGVPAGATGTTPPVTITPTPVTPEAPAPTTPPAQTPSTPVPPPAATDAAAPVTTPTASAPAAP